MAKGESQMAQAGDWRQAYIEHRFGVLLVILVVLLAGPPILLGFGLSAVWFDGLLALLMVAVIVSLCFERHQRLFSLVLGIPVLLSLGGHALPEEASAAVLVAGHVCGVLFLFGASALIVKSLFSTSTLKFDSIFGAVCGFLFLGLGWAVLYSMIESFRPGSFAISPKLVTDGEVARPLPHVMTYYSFITLTTVGYGDISPVSATTRTLAWMEAITGQFYVAVIVAGLVSVLAARGKPEGEP